MKKIDKRVIVLRYNFFMLISLILGGIAYAGARTNRDSIPVPIINPVVAQAIPTPTPTSTPTPILNESEVEKEIRRVFEDDAPKAFLLLRGKVPGDCAENRTLNPRAVNDNREWGGKGRDRGIFQISDYWHPGVSDQCAFDYKCNIAYAHRMFTNDGGSFRRWTCGKLRGI